MEKFAWSNVLGKTHHEKEVAVSFVVCFGIKAQFNIFEGNRKPSFI